MDKKGKMKAVETYRVWIGQINGTYIDVAAKCSESAKDKASRKWRAEYAYAEITDVKKTSDTK